MLLIMSWHPLFLPVSSCIPLLNDVKLLSISCYFSSFTKRVNGQHCLV